MTDGEYEVALARIRVLMDLPEVDLNTPEGRELDALAQAVDVYEQRFGFADV